MPNKNITFQDIAQYTHFSKTTISRYFNHPESVTQENKRIIEAALEKLDYKENKVAQILAKGSTEFIGVLVPNLYLHYYADMLEHILGTYKQYGYKFIVFSANDDVELERQYIKELMAYKIEGLLVLSNCMSSKELSQYLVPVVGIERESMFINSVEVDNYAGAIGATRLLHDHHCDLMIHINTVTDTQMPCYKRITGFEDYCREHDLVHEVIMISESGISLTRELDEIVTNLDKVLTTYPQRKIGFFVSSDTYANLLVNRLVLKYGKVPERVFVIGFDNSPVSREGIIPITTVDQHIAKLAEEAVGLLVDKIKKAGSGKREDLMLPEHKVIPVTLIERMTTTK